MTIAVQWDIKHKVNLLNKSSYLICKLTIVHFLSAVCKFGEILSVEMASGNVSRYGKPYFLIDISV